MHSRFLVDDDLTDVCGTEIKNVLGYLSDLDIINNKIMEELEDDNWTGETHDKCVGAIGMMEKYRADLYTMCEILNYNIETVVRDAEDFVDYSDKVAAIRKV